MRRYVVGIMEDFSTDRVRFEGSRFLMSNRKSEIIIVIGSFAIAFVLKEFLSIQDEKVKNVVAVVAALFIIPIFVKGEPFGDFMSFGAQLLKTLVLLIALVLFVNLIDFFPR